MHSHPSGPPVTPLRVLVLSRFPLAPFEILFPYLSGVLPMCQGVGLCVCSPWISWSFSCVDSYFPVRLRRFWPFCHKYRFCPVLAPLGSHYVALVCNGGRQALRLCLLHSFLFLSVLRTEAPRDLSSRLLLLLPTRSAVEASRFSFR